MLKLLTTLFIFYCLSFSLYASSKIQVLTLHSYSQEYPWTKSQHKGFVETLQNSQKEFSFYSEHLDTKRLNLTPQYQEDFLNYLNNKYSFKNIDIIYVTDDNALSFIFAHYKKLLQDGHKIPIFFSGVNNLKMQEILPKETFLGVYEIKGTEQNIELIKQFSPQTRDIYFLGDTSQTFLSIQKTIKEQESKYKNMTFHYISDEHIAEVEAKLPTKPRSFVLLTTIGELKDEQNATLLVQESIQKLHKNKNLILLTMEDTYMHKGVIGGYVTNGFSQGQEAAHLLLEYLEKGSLKTLVSLNSSPNIYMFNTNELTSARVILSEYISRNAVLIGKNKNFIERNNSNLLSASVIIIILLSFSMFIMNALFRTRCKKLTNSKKEEELLSIKLKLNSKDSFIHNMMALANIGYWRFDTQKDELYLSDTLVEILSIDRSIYQGDSAVLSYFIHEYDKDSFAKNMHDVIKTKKTLTFTHKMITSNKDILKVKHMIYAQYLGQEASAIIMGIIQFEE